MGQTIRIRPETRLKLEGIAKAESTTMTKVLDKVVDAYRRQRMLEETNSAFADLKKDSKLWEQEQKERREWDAAMGDGLKDDE
jgi:hypothetical protein